MYATTSTSSTMRSKEIQPKMGHGPGDVARRALSVTIAALLAIGLFAGLSSCSSSSTTSQVSKARSRKPSEAKSTTGGQNPGGSLHPASPAERKKALSSYGAYNRLGIWGGGSYNPMGGQEPKNSLLSHLLGSLPPEDLPEVSNNWSGYQVLSADTKVAASQASGSWVVPSVSAPRKNEDGFSSIWVGIGGSCLDAACHVPDQTLIQLGTAEDASPSGAKLYYAWYELLPAASVEIKSLEIAPGDKVSASLGLVGSKSSSSSYNPGFGGQRPGSYNPVNGGQRPGSYNPGNIGAGGRYNPMTGVRRPKAYESSSATMNWLLSISVTSPSGAVQHWSKTVSYASSLASAEWVVEGPSASCNGTIGELPLADYHSLSFSSLMENSKAPSLGISNLVIGYDPYGELSLPAPSFLLKGRTATYYLPFVAKGSAETAGQATCNTVGGRRGGSYNPITGVRGPG